jgi:hypothetical protein
MEVPRMTVREVPQAGRLAGCLTIERAMMAPIDRPALIAQFGVEMETFPAA